jgi:hypothetical protein
MADSVPFVIHLPNSFKAEAVRWSHPENAKTESKSSSHIWISGEPVAPVIEIFVLLLFVLVAVVATIGCFVELIHLLDSDALGQVVAKALQGEA